VKLLLDTNRYSDLAGNNPDVRKIVEAAEEVYLPFVVLAELRAGFRSGTRLRENEQWLKLFLARPSVGVLYATDETTHHYATVHEQLRRQGTPIPTNDMWIAAIVLQPA
jgi:tRNA(fMet)-specific endonuclease VapC